MGDTLYVFPEYYSDKALKEVQKHGKEEDIPVYRVAKYGKDKTIAFLNYYEEVINGYKFIKPSKLKSTLEKYTESIDSLSVSYYYDYKDIKYYYSVTLKESYPERILLKWITSKKVWFSAKIV